MLSLFSRLRLFLPLSAMLAGAVVLAGCQWLPGQSGLPGGTTGQPADSVTVFFSKYHGSQSIVEEVVRPVPPGQREEPIRFALDALLAGPTPEESQHGFYSEIPKGTQLLGVSRQGNTLTLNFSRQFALGGGANSIQQRLEEVKQTVFSNDSRHAVEIAVEGQKLELLGGEGLEVEEVLQRDPQ